MSSETDAAPGRRHRPRPASLFRPASLRGRVVIGVLVLLLVLLTALFTTVDLLLRERLQSDLRTRLTDRVALATQLDGALSSQDLVNRLRGDGVSALLCAARSTSTTSGGGRPQCVTADSGPPAPGDASSGRSQGRPPGAPAKPQPGAKATVAKTSVESADSTLFVRTVLPSTGQTLTLSVDSSQVGATLNRLLVLEIVGGLVALVLAVLLLVRLVGTALRPLDHMTGLARRIGAGDRGRRLGTGRPDTELGRTATAFDDMLDALESALAEAAAAEARLRGFLNDVSHELRTPLTGLAATTETLLRDEPAAAEREQAYVTLVRETRRAGRLVDDLLMVTRLDTGMSLATEPVDVVEIATQELARSTLLAPQLHTELHTDGPAVVDGDPVRLGQILANLLDNARTAAGPQGSVRVEVERVGDDWHVDVVDSGPGVPAEDRERIFERLVRLDASRSRERGGFGLGLPIARALARAHGGELACVGPDGAGGRFRLTLPAVRVSGAPGPDGRGGRDDSQPATLTR
ncbi:ATP-binding protein [uncultured Jatrophihabitans sp.]|uniref:HAMP domain-containing sensor histidine kinase n=1 Tax=uncultured Jatrophihabitans sp. TaxID=1610747 RepID=UPI0035CAE6FE